METDGSLASKAVGNLKEGAEFKCSVAGEKNISEESFGDHISGNLLVTFSKPSI